MRVLSEKSSLNLILIDQKNHHTFQPLLYQVATACLNPSDITSTLRAQFSNRSNTRIYLGKVESVDLRMKLVSVGDIQVTYDFLILACGAKHSYLGHPEWEEYAPGLKTIEQAIEIRNRILVAFENAEKAITESMKLFKTTG